MKTRSLGMLAGSVVAMSATSGVFADGMNSDEVRALVSEVIADSNSRSQSLAAGADAGRDGKFYISDGGGFRLNVSGQIQFRYIVNLADEGGVTGDDFESGFQTRRTKLVFDGTAYEDMFYKVQGAFARGSGTFGLEEAYVGKKLDSHSKVMWGQFKTAFLREENVSSKHQLAADRSLVNEVFNQDYSQGIAYHHQADDWSFDAAFTDGFGSRNTEFTSLAEADFGLTARAQYKHSGTWKQFNDFSGSNQDDYGLLFGGALHYQESDDADFELFTYTLDVSVEGSGWNFFAAFVGSSTDTGGGDFDDFGAVVQGGMMLPDSDWEIFGRWDILIPDSDRTFDDDFSTLTFGVNNYIHGHAAKFTLDLQWFLNDENGLSGANTGIGYTADDDEDEVAIRAQFQFLF